nr:NADH dehydrogenase subunit 5 [Coenobita brevimanus]
MIWKISMHLTSMVFLMFFSLISLFMSLLCLFDKTCYVIEWEILSINSSSIVATYIFDWMSLMFMGFVMFISAMVLFYSGSYMEGDPNMNRFMYLVLAFVLSMIFLIISPNLISILLGWDGLGLVSYALVIYYQNEKSANAGMLTVLSNRVGDVAILLSIALMFVEGGWNFIFHVLYLDDNSALLMKSLIIMAAMTKSAQIPFSAWLPAAMAAPTPVSALVHSSTLVTAGVYLLIRFSPALSETTLPTLLLFSSLTMFMSGLGANFEYDLKKIIALSTLSQLGVMLSILALGFKDLAFFHLLTHALFKALLFMCAGAMIHNVKEYQDIRLMGSLVTSMPLTCMCMNLANLALCGTPFLAGFYSKDLILEIAFMSWINTVILFLYIFATMLTVCYTFRLIFYSMTGEFNLASFSNIDDSSSIMTSPMLALSSGAILSGALLSWLIFPESYIICLSPLMKNLVLTISILGGLMGYLLNIMNVNFKLNSLNLYPLVVFSGSMWFLPFLSTFNLSKSSLNMGQNYSKTIDKGWSEISGGQGIFQTLMNSSKLHQMISDSNFKSFMKVFLILTLMLSFFNI